MVHPFRTRHHRIYKRCESCWHHTMHDTIPNTFRLLPRLFLQDIILFLHIYNVGNLGGEVFT